MYYGLFMILVLPVGWVPWRFLQLLAAGFERKRFSDVQLIVDCWWLIVTAEQIVTHLASPYGVGGIAAGLVAFIAYRVTVALSLSRLPQAEHNVRCDQTAAAPARVRIPGLRHRDAVRSRRLSSGAFMGRSS